MQYCFLFFLQFVTLNCLMRDVMEMEESVFRLHSGTCVETQCIPCIMIHALMHYVVDVFPAKSCQDLEKSTNQSA